MKLNPQSLIPITSETLLIIMGSTKGKGHMSHQGRGVIPLACPPENAIAAVFCHTALFYVSLQLNLYFLLHSSLWLTRDYLREGCPLCVLFPQETSCSSSFLNIQLSSHLNIPDLKTVDIWPIALDALAKEKLGQTDTESA